MGRTAVCTFFASFQDGGDEDGGDQGTGVLDFLRGHAEVTPVGESLKMWYVHGVSWGTPLPTPRQDFTHLHDIPGVGGDVQAERSFDYIGVHAA